MMYCINLGTYTNEYSICVSPSCVLENEGVSECYKRKKFNKLSRNVTMYRFYISYHKMSLCENKFGSPAKKTGFKEN